MRGALKLESFAPDPGKDGHARALAQEIETAYRAGLADGRAQQQDANIAAMIQAVSDLKAELSREDDRLSRIRADAVRDLTPVLSATIDALAPSGMSARLENGLIDELTLIARSSPPVQCRIECSPQLRQIVDRCTAVAALDDIEVAETARDGHVILNMGGGHIEFSQDDIVRSVRALINEIQED